MREKIYYYPGFKTSYVILGLLILTAGVFICLNQSIWFLSIPFFIFAIILIASIQGTRIDYHNRILDRYTDFLIFKTHQYFDLNCYKKITIEYAREFADASNENDDMAARSGIFGSTISFSTEVKSYEIYFYAENGEKLFLVEFGAYTEAQNLADKLVDRWKLLLEDKVQQNINHVKQKAVKRRR